VSVADTNVKQTTDLLTTSESTNNSAKLLKKCIEMIPNVVKSSASVEEKHNITKKCLYVLRLMIQESEKMGTAHVKSHFGLQKKKIYKLKILSQTYRINDCEVVVYGNTTMWELKEIISKKVKASVDFIKLEIKKNVLKESSNGKSIIDMQVRFII